MNSRLSVLRVSNQGACVERIVAHALLAGAERLEGMVVLVAVNVLIVHALADAAFAGHGLPSIDLGALPVLFYSLLTVLFVGHILSQAATIWLYRA